MVKSFLPQSAPNNKGLKIIVTLLILALIATGGYAFYLTKRVKSPSEAQSAKLISRLQEESKQQLITYRSSKFGYEITFDPRVWKEGVLTDLSQENLPSISLSLRQGYGFAYFILNASYPDSLENRKEVVLEKKPDFKGDDLDFVAERREETIAETNDQQIKYAGKERLKRGEKDVYKLTFKESYLGEDTEYYEYILIANGTIYNFLVKYPQIGNSKNLVEGAIDSFIFFPISEEKVKGASSKEESANLLTEAKIAELAKPSVVNILQLYCHRLVFPNTAGTRFLKSSYRFCSGAKGSGFIVNDNGYVATNGHVAKIYPEEAMVLGVYYGELDPFLIDLIIESSYQNGEEITPLEAKALFSLISQNPNGLDVIFEAIYKLLDQKLMTIEEEGVKLFVKLGSESFSLNTAKIKAGDVLGAVAATSSILEADLIDYDYPNIYSLDAILRKSNPQGSDVALLKIKNSQNLSFPALKIGDSGALKEGAPLVVIGYPGLVEGSTSESSLLSNESSAKPTITRGIVSAIKTDQGGRKLIQTDASIDHGNSGGPAFNSQGEVIGIATYGFESKSGNYNFLRDISDLNNLTSKTGISNETGKVYLSWQSGLDSFWAEYYKRAVKSFEEVRQLYPIHPSISSYISDAEAAIEKGEDKTPIFGNIGSSTLIIIVVAGVVLIAGIILGVYFMKKRKQTPPPTPIPPSAPTPSVISQPPTPTASPTYPV